MSRPTQHVKNMLTYLLLLGCLLQVDIGRATPNPNVLVARDTTDAVTSAASTVSSTTTGALSGLTSNLTALVNNTGTALKTFGSEATKSVEEALGAGGRVTLAVGDMASELLDGVTATASTGTSLLSSGVGTINNYTNSIPVVGTLTGGLSSLLSGLSGTVGDVSSTARKSRQSMFKTLRNQLNNLSSSSNKTSS